MIPSKSPGGAVPKVVSCSEAASGTEIPKTRIEDQDFHVGSRVLGAPEDYFDLPSTRSWAWVSQAITDASTPKETSDNHR